jgi:hypothetical protein
MNIIPNVEIKRLNNRRTESLNKEVEYSQVHVELRMTKCSEQNKTLPAPTEILIVSELTIQFLASRWLTCSRKTRYMWQLTWKDEGSVGIRKRQKQKTANDCDVVTLGGDLRRLDLRLERAQWGNGIQDTHNVLNSFFFSITNRILFRISNQSIMKIGKVSAASSPTTVCLQRKSKVLSLRSAGCFSCC